MTSIPFIKMHGLGNDFVIFNSGDLPEGSSYIDIVKLADRRLGIGCDQVIMLGHSKETDVNMRIFNTNGREAEACGNASRCVGWLMMQESGARDATIETRAGILHCEQGNMENIVTIDMGPPRLEWDTIPLAKEVDTLKLDLHHGSLSSPVAVNMGNPHAVFFVNDIDAIDLEACGPTLEQDSLFPESANISVAQIIADNRIKVRVWERDVGITPACGTAACAALVAACRRGFVPDRKATVELPGGELEISWQTPENGENVLMSGPVAVSFHGNFELAEYGR